MAPRRGAQKVVKLRMTVNKKHEAEKTQIREEYNKCYRELVVTIDNANNEINNLREQVQQGTVAFGTVEKEKEEFGEKIASLELELEQKNLEMTTVIQEREEIEKAELLHATVNFYEKLGEQRTEFENEVAELRKQLEDTVLQRDHNARELEDVDRIVRMVNDNLEKLRHSERYIPKEQLVKIEKSRRLIAAAALSKTPTAVAAEKIMKEFNLFPSTNAKNLVQFLVNEIAQKDGVIMALERGSTAKALNSMEK